MLKESKSQTAASYSHLRVPGFAFDAGANSGDEESASDCPKKRRRRQANVAETTVWGNSVSGRTETRMSWDEEGSSISSVDPSTGMHVRSIVDGQEDPCYKDLT